MKFTQVDTSTRICIIPARGGSKRIPKKNIRLFRGQPIICWSIQAAQESECFDRIIVSTDDENIANVAQHAGAEVPFLRPPSLSNDFAGTREVIHHAIDTLRAHKYFPEEVCCLYATAPFAFSSRIQQGLSLLRKSTSRNVVFTATSFSTPIQRALKIDNDGYSSPFESSSISQRSQDLDVAYHDAGQFYWADADRWCTGEDLLSSGRALLLPRWSAVDIDTEEDWLIAEYLHSFLSS